MKHRVFSGKGIIAAVIFAAVLPLAAQETSVTLSVDGKPALALKVPAAAKLDSTNGYVKIQTTNLTLHVWAVPNAKTVDEALPRAAEIIKSEFVNFKTNATMDMIIAGAPASMSSVRATRPTMAIRVTRRWCFLSWAAGFLPGACMEKRTTLPRRAAMMAVLNDGLANRRSARYCIELKTMKHRIVSSKESSPVILAALPFARRRQSASALPQPDISCATKSNSPLTMGCSGCRRTKTATAGGPPLSIRP